MLIKTPRLPALESKNCCALRHFRDPERIPVKRYYDEELPSRCCRMVSIFTTNVFYVNSANR